MSEIEHAVRLGVARVMIPGEDARRIRELRADRPVTPARETDGAWARALAADMSAYMGRAERVLPGARPGEFITGPSDDGPMSGRPPH